MKFVRTLFSFCALIVVVNCTACNLGKSSALVTETIIFTVTPPATQPPRQQIVSTPRIAKTAIPPNATVINSDVSPLPTYAHLVRYQGENMYSGQAPRFEISYDPAIWAFANDATTGWADQLIYLQDPECKVVLRGGARSAVPIGKVTLSDKEWDLSGSANTLQYSFHFNEYAYIVTVKLSEEYNDTVQSLCQRLAEEVITTYSLVGE